LEVRKPFLLFSLFLLEKVVGVPVIIFQGGFLLGIILLGQLIGTDLRRVLNSQLIQAFKAKIFWIGQF